MPRAREGGREREREKERKRERARESARERAREREREIERERERERVSMPTRDSPAPWDHSSPDLSVRKKKIKEGNLVSRQVAVQPHPDEYS